MIESGDMNTIGSERLRGLQKILPETDEVLFCTYSKVIDFQITLFHDLKNIKKLDLFNILFKACKTLFWNLQDLYSMFDKTWWSLSFFAVLFHISQFFEVRCQ